MVEVMRKSGVAAIADVPWGTHLCQFYNTKEDLIDVLVPYFKAGLDNNEFCMWITSVPLGVEDAKASLGKTVSNLDDYTKRGQIEIVDYSQWYTKSGKFNADEVIQGWLDREGMALEKGFDGLRLTGNTFWLQKNDWADFMAYEATIDNILKEQRIIAICTYSLDKCGTSETIDVAKNHELAITKKGRYWTAIETAASQVTKERDKFLKSFIKNPKLMAIGELAEGRYTDVNDSFVRITGYSREDVIGRKLTDFDCIQSDTRAKLQEILRDRGKIYDLELEFHTKSGETRPGLFAAETITIGGQPHLLCSMNDITEYKRMEGDKRLAEVESSKSQQELRNLSARLQSLREEERTSVAHEINNELRQALTALRMDLAWLSKRLPEENKVLLDKTETMSEVIDATSQVVRRISTNLRPGMLDDLGLVPAMEWLAGEFRERTGTKVGVTFEPEDIVLERDLSTAIFRIFQELLTNVSRHARATRVVASLKEKAGMLELRVKDNGRGIKERQISGSKSLGLVGIRERAYLFGGKLEIKGTPGKGTTAIVCIPVSGGVGVRDDKNSGS